MLKKMMLALLILAAIALLPQPAAAAWFNDSCLAAVPINIQNHSTLTAATNFPLKVLLNGSDVNYSKLQDWNVTFTMDNVTARAWWNATKVNVSGQSIVYVNTTINTTANTTLWMYYNCSFNAAPSLNLTFGSDVSFFATMNDDLNDLSDRKQTPVLTNTPVSVRNDTDIIERRYGYGSFVRNEGDHAHYGLPLFNSSQTILVRARSLATPATNYSGIFYAYAATKSQVRLTVGTDDDADFELGIDPGVCSGDVADGFIDDDWHDFALRFDDDANNLTIYYDGLQNTTVACTETGLYNPGQDFPVGAIYNNASGYGLTGFIDELLFVEGAKSYDWIRLWHDQPLFTTGVEEVNVAQTVISVSLLNASRANQTSMTEGPYYLFALNYSFEANGSSASAGNCSVNGSVFNGSMPFNATSGLFESAYGSSTAHGTYLHNWSCIYPSGGVENQTGSYNITVDNVPCALTFNDLETWLGNVSFTNATISKYPIWPITTVPVDINMLAYVSLTGYASEYNITWYWTNSTGDVIDTTGTTLISPGPTVGFLHDISGMSPNNLYYVNASCTDGVNASTWVMWFNASNLAPTVTWDNSSMSIPSTPANLSWTCVDDEGQTYNSTLWINASNLSVTPNATFTNNASSWLFNLPEGTYNLTIRCNDAYQDSETSELILTYIESCVITFLNSVCEGCRYQDDTIQAGVNCSNGAALDACWYSINDFANITVENCSAFNISAERGWNRLTMTVQSGSVVGTTEIDLWAKKLDATIWDFPVMMWMIAVALLLVLAGAYTRIPVFHFAAGCVIAYVGWEVLALSTWAGYLCMAGGALYGVVMVLLGMSD